MVRDLISIRYLYCTLLHALQTQLHNRTHDDRQTDSINQWFSTTVLRAACASQAPFVGPSAVFQQYFVQQTSFCNKQNVSIDLC